MKRKPLTPNQRAELFIAHDGRCISCGGKILTGDNWHVGHVIALALGGSDAIENMGPEHARCNMKDAHENVAPKAAKVRRVRKKHLGVKRPKGFWKPKGAKYNWQSGRYEIQEQDI